MVQKLTHDLKTPLNCSMGLIQCAIKKLGEESEISRKYLTKAYNSSEL